MAATTRRRPLPGPSGPVLRPPYPSGRFHAPPPPPSASSFASSSSSTFASRASAAASATSFFRRSASPTRVNLHSPAQPSPSIRFALDRPTSPSRSISVSQQRGGGGGQFVRSSGQKPAPRRTCMCSPTTHPGSFRCSLHKGCGPPSAGAGYAPNRLNARRSAMTNSLVRIGGVEGDLVRRALAALIRPSSHQQRRRSAFQPRPSRLSVMSRAAEEEHSLILSDPTPDPHARNLRKSSRRSAARGKGRLERRRRRRSELLRRTEVFVYSGDRNRRRRRSDPMQQIFKN
ncbi:hypothetical protein NL676_036226 [Syzygium grande]|nr:hypothetical protein NL676_036226 [Syzygium grande]